MKQPYIFESIKNKELNANEAIIMFPDIYGQTDYSKRTAEEFVEAFNKPVFMFDYFYMVTGKVSNFGENNRDEVHNLMDTFMADRFVVFFRESLTEIKKTNPLIKQFIIIGFCFGGRLAYIAGGDPEITKVFSFYGSGANTLGYVLAKTPIEYLISKRKESDLKVFSFFGARDQSIPEIDRLKIKEELTKAKISYESHEYDAGHAYFQEGRPNYDPIASDASWEVLRQCL